MRWRTRGERRRQIEALEAEAASIHGDWSNERVRLLALILAAVKRYTAMTQRTLDLSAVCKHGENVVPLAEAKDTEYALRLVALASRAGALGAPYGAIQTSLDHTAFPSPEQIAAASALLNNI